MVGDYELTVRDDGSSLNYEVWVNCKEYCVHSVRIPKAHGLPREIADAFAVETLACEYKTVLYATL